VQFFKGSLWLNGVFDKAHGLVSKIGTTEVMSRYIVYLYYRARHFAIVETIAGKWLRTGHWHCHKSSHHGREES
jgi:hypothetical protein